MMSYQIINMLKTLTGCKCLLFASFQYASKLMNYVIYCFIKSQYHQQKRGTSVCEKENKIQGKRNKSTSILRW